MTLVSCDKKASREEGARSLPDTAHAKGEKTLLRIDTLREDEFMALFTEVELRKYDLFSKKELTNRLNDSYNFWRHKRLILKDSLKQLNVWGYPLSFKIVNGIKRITTLTEGENQVRIAIFTLDEFYNTQDINFLTSYGGDEMVSERITGTFINDTLYHCVDKIITYSDNGDSTIAKLESCLLFRRDGKIERVENCR